MHLNSLNRIFNIIIIHFLSSYDFLMISFFYIFINMDSHARLLTLILFLATVHPSKLNRCCKQGLESGVKNN